MGRPKVQRQGRPGLEGRGHPLAKVMLIASLAAGRAWSAPPADAGGANALPSGEVTARYATALEAWIRDDPAGWWWSHRRWKLRRPVY